ncbi:MAG: Foldase protein PrsA [Fimbriimonadaceae bacterium]|nr:Foldase protein PrsA [Fimbriimonadaceae bacterium]
MTLKRFLSVAWIAVASLASAQVDLSKDVVVVNGQAVKGSEYYRRMEFLSGVGKMTPGGFAPAPPGFLTLQRIVDEKLMLQLCDQRKCTPTEAEIKQELDDRVAENTDLLKNWAASGGTEAELNYAIKLELAELKIVSQGITVTDQELEAFYKTNPTMFTFPKRFKLRLLAVPDEAKRDAAEADLKGGMSFPEAVKKHSDHASKFNDGLLGELPVDVMSTNLKTAVDGVKIGSATDWIRTEGGFYKFLIENITPERVQPLDDRTKRQLRRKLAVDRGRVKTDISKLMAEARSKAKVEVNIPTFQSSISKYLKDSGGLLGG